MDTRLPRRESGRAGCAFAGAGVGMDMGMGEEEGGGNGSGGGCGCGWEKTGKSKIFCTGGGVETVVGKMGEEDGYVEIWRRQSITFVYI